MREAYRFGSAENGEVLLPGSITGADANPDIIAVTLSSEYKLEKPEEIPPIQSFEVHKVRAVRSIGYQGITLAQRKTLGHIQRNSRK